MPLGAETNGFLNAGKLGAKEAVPSYLRLQGMQNSKLSLSRGAPRFPARCLPPALRTTAETLLRDGK